jgi:hypothetical protein
MVSLHWKGTLEPTATMGIHTRSKNNPIRLTANEFADPPAAIDYYKPLYEMHLSSQSHSADCYPLCSITIAFEGAWAQKWVQKHPRRSPLAQRICGKVAVLEPYSAEIDVAIVKVSNQPATLTNC